MAAAWVLSKGLSANATIETFVPEGVIVRVYGGVTTAALGESGLVTLASGDLAPGLEVTGPDPITNYTMSAFGDTAAATALGGAKDLSGTVVAIGDTVPDGTALCSNPSVCAAPHHAADCTGLFNQVREVELYLVELDGAAAAGNAAAGGGGPGNAYAQHAADLLGYARTDPGTMLAQFHSYDMEMQVLLVQSSPEMLEWLTQIGDPAAAAAKQVDAAPANHWIEHDYRLWLIDAPMPASIEAVWQDAHWKHVFETWFTTAPPAPATGPEAALVTLLDALTTYRDSQTEENLTLLLEVCEGQHGPVPACDAGDRSLLKEAVDARTEHGGEQSETPENDAAMIKEALSRLDQGVLAQFSMIFSTFAAEVDRLKSAAG